MPLIGEIIPSRWSYEALAVTSFTDNDYEKPFFELDKAKQENQFYNMAFLYELQSQLETMNDEKRRGKEVDPNHLRVIHTNLPVLTAYCGMQPYEGDDSYQSLYEYMQQAERILKERGNRATMNKENRISAFIRKNGKEALLDLKRDNYNIKLEDIVIGADQQHMVQVVDEYLVPRMATVYLTPQSHTGRAPFYSSEKILGSWHIKTLWFNMGVIGLMCLLAVILLLNDCPGRYMRKEQ